MKYHNGKAVKETISCVAVGTASSVQCVRGGKSGERLRFGVVDAKLDDPRGPFQHALIGKEWAGGCLVFLH